MFRNSNIFTLTLCIQDCRLNQSVHNFKYIGKGCPQESKVPNPGFKSPIKMKKSR